ncbi:MAG: acetate--CoA ligase family protein [Defluviitaleaceae bacterium]|nr:acetate--CoA ligase family protein [Defluviitaleaceae bacterium]
MLLTIHSQKKGKLRVVGLMSGTGKTLWKAHEMQKEMQKESKECPFEIVGAFASDPNCKGLEYAKAENIPFAALDIKEFYKEKNKPISDMQVREEYDKEILKKIELFNADIILLAGYVWKLSDLVLENHTIINVHPGDLTVVGTEGRKYAGKDGVGDALRAKESYIASTSHIVTPVLDGGPILMVSEDIDVDYTLHDDEQARFRHYLGLVNEQGRMLGARTLLEIALGNFSRDKSGNIYYKSKAVPSGLKIENWDEYRPLHERDIDKLVNARSVAVIGASNRQGIGRAVVENIISYGYEGSLYAVNLKGEDVLSAKGYERIADIEKDVDLVIMTIPSKGVLQVVEECGKKGVKAIICITAGFKEVGGEGIVAEEKLLQIVHKYNMRMTGPNCMGLMFAGSKLNATILSGEIKQGNVALISQSGAVGATLLDNAIELGIGLSANISLGNQADVNVCDLLEILDKDENTEVIAMYLEAIPEPDRFYAITSKINKPILLLKSGATEAGATAASSHTGSLAGNDKIANALIEKCGIRRMETMEELFLSLPGVSMMPAVKGNRICVVTNAGGPGILITDALSKRGFEVPELSAEKQKQLAPLLMAEASTHNPIDVVAPAPPHHFADAIKTAAKSGEYDAIVLCCVSPATSNTTATAEGVLEAIKNADIPVVSCFTGRTIGKDARDLLIKNGIPAYSYPEHVAFVLDNMRAKAKGDISVYERTDPAATNKARNILDQTDIGVYMPNAQAYELLDCYGISYAKNVVVKSVAEVDTIAIDYPVVAKIEHPEIVHKSDVGGVVLNIKNSVQLKSVVEQFIKKFAGAVGVLVQEMIPQGFELIIGCAQDPELGNALMVGMGGTLVEIMQDVEFLYLPINAKEAMAALKRLKCFPLLEGYRGEAGVDLEKLVEIMAKASNMLVSLPDITELDLNPIIYHEKKGVFMAADVRIKRG